MNGLVYHIVSGHAFFSGICLVIIAVLASTRSHPICSRVTVLSFLFGVIAVVISVTSMEGLNGRSRRDTTSLSFPDVCFFPSLRAVTRRWIRFIFRSPATSGWPIASGT